MPRVRSIAAHVWDYTGGLQSFEVTALTIRHLLHELDQRFPGLGLVVEESMAIAVDGEIFQDAPDTPLHQDSEIVLIPRLSGG